jgi:hypothetical protein
MGSEQAKTWKLRKPRQAGETCRVSQPEESVIRNGWVTHHASRIALPFPDHFVFELTWEGMVGISQTVISLPKLKLSRQAAPGASPLKSETPA